MDDESTRCHETLDLGMDSLCPAPEMPPTKPAAPQTPMTLREDLNNTSCNTTWNRLNAAGILTTVKKATPRIVEITKQEDDFDSRHGSSGFINRLSDCDGEYLKPSLF